MFLIDANNTVRAYQRVD